MVENGAGAIDVERSSEFLADLFQIDIFAMQPVVLIMEGVQAETSNVQRSTSNVERGGCRLIRGGGADIPVRGFERRSRLLVRALAQMADETNGPVAQFLI